MAIKMVVGSMHVVMSDTQYKVSVIAKVTRKSFIRLVSCVVQLTACLIPFWFDLHEY